MQWFYEPSSELNHAMRIKAHVNKYTRIVGAFQQENSVKKLCTMHKVIIWICVLANRTRRPKWRRKRQPPRPRCPSKGQRRTSRFPARTCSVTSEHLPEFMPIKVLRYGGEDHVKQNSQGKEDEIRPRQSHKRKLGADPWGEWQRH